MAASVGYRPMTEKEWKPEYKVAHTDLVVVDYDTHPRYARGTVLTKTGTPIHIEGDKWRNRSVDVEPISAVNSPDNEVSSSANESGLPDNDPQYKKFLGHFSGLLVDDDGKPNIEKLLNELYDYWRRSELLDEIIEEYSGGKLSAGRIYFFSSVKDVFDCEINELVESNVDEALGIALSEGVAAAVEKCGSPKLKSRQDVKFE